MGTPDGGGFTRPDVNMARDTTPRDTAPRITCGGETCGRNQPYCLNDSICAECQANTDCTGNQPVCSLTTGQCEQCVANTDCTGGRVCRENRCEISCTSDTDCAAPDGGRGGGATKCNSSTKECVQCMTDADCTNGQTCRTTTFTCQRQTPDGGGMTMRDGGGFTMPDGGDFTRRETGGTGRD
jgi:Cys-rich repeat protein